MTSFSLRILCTFRRVKPFPDEDGTRTSPGPPPRGTLRSIRLRSAFEDGKLGRFRAYGDSLCRCGELDIFNEVRYIQFFVFNFYCFLPVNAIGKWKRNCGMGFWSAIPATFISDTLQFA